MSMYATLSSMQTVVARFTCVGEAEAARSALDAVGIESRIGDENIISIDWLYSNAVGGVKLLVADEDRDEAAELLATRADDATDAIADSQVETDETVETGIEASEMRCPSCGSDDVRRVPRMMLFLALGAIAFGVGTAINQPGLALAAIAAVGLITAASPSHRCRRCGERWNAKDAREAAAYAPPPERSDTLERLCPRCGSRDFYRTTYRRLRATTLFGLAPLLVLLPIWAVLPRWKCDSCGYGSHSFVVRGAPGN